jgi:hypothetical protein
MCESVCKSLSKRVLGVLSSSFVDPWHFGTDSDPRIRTTGLRILIRILLFSSVAFKISTKISFLLFTFWRYLYNVHLHKSSKIKRHKEVAKQLKSRFFLLFVVDGRRIRIGSVPLTDLDPNFGGPKHYGASGFGSGSGSGSTTLLVRNFVSGNFCRFYPLRNIVFGHCSISPPVCDIASGQCGRFYPFRNTASGQCCDPVQSATLFHTV